MRARNALRLAAFAFALTFVGSALVGLAIWQGAGRERPLSPALLAPLATVSLVAAVLVVVVRELLVALDVGVPPGSTARTLARVSARAALTLAAAMTGAFAILSLPTATGATAWAETSFRYASLGVLGVVLFAVVRHRQLERQLGVSLRAGEIPTRASFAKKPKDGRERGIHGALTLTNRRIAFRADEARGHGDADIPLQTVRAVALRPSMNVRSGVILETESGTQEFFVGDAEQWVDAIRAARTSPRAEG